MHCIRLAGECSQCQRHLNSATDKAGGGCYQQDYCSKQVYKCRSGVVQVSFRCRSGVVQVSQQKREKERKYAGIS